MATYGTRWSDHDFRPAAPGWRLAWLDENSPLGFFTTVLPGWLVQVETRYNPATYATQDSRPAADRERRVVAASYDASDGTIDAVDGDHSNFWYVLDPTDPDPTAEEAAAERTGRLSRYYPAVTT